MQYRVRRATTGKRPYQIINMKSGEVVGTSESKGKAQRSIEHRTKAESKNFKNYKRSVNNKMGWYGETDYKKQTIKVNKLMSKKSPMYKRPITKGARKYPDVLDTIVHEKMHVEHPKRLEINIRKATKKKIKTMSKKTKQKHYNLFKA